MSRLLAWITAAPLITISALVIYQVFARYILNSPNDFTEKIVKHLLIWIGSIDVAYGFSTHQHMALLIAHNKLAPRWRRYLTYSIGILIFVFALAVFTVGGARPAFSARKEFSSLLEISRSLAYDMAPVSGVLIMAAQTINIWEDLTRVTIKEEI